MPKWFDDMLSNVVAAGQDLPETDGCICPAPAYVQDAVFIQIDPVCPVHGGIDLIEEGDADGEPDL